MIKFGDLDWTQECKDAICDLVNTADPMLTHGKFCYQFEREFAKWIGSKHAVFVNSGTSALMCGLMAVKDTHGYKAKDVWTSALTHPSDWEAIKYCGLKPRLRDVNNQFVMDMDFTPPRYESLIMPIHLLGKPCPNAYDIVPDIEDACETMGSSIYNKKLGTYGTVGCFSFYVNHVMTTVEGGMIVTDLEEIYQKLLSARDYGRFCNCPICTLKVSGVCKKRFTNSSTNERRWETGDVIGGNFHPTEFQGVLGCIKMKTIDENVSRRNKIFLRYFEEFHTLEQGQNEYIVTIAYPVKVKNPQKSVQYLESVGVEARGMFPYYNTSFKNATMLSNSHILIPLHHKMSDEDVEKVIEETKKCQSLL